MSRTVMKVGVALLAMSGAVLFAAPVSAGSGTTVPPTTVPPPGTSEPTPASVSAAGDVAATCAILRQIDALDDLGDPTTDDPQAVAAQLGQAAMLFDQAAAAAPAEIAGEFQAFADGLWVIQGIVEQIAAQQGQPTPEQEQQLAAMQDQLKPPAQAFQAWALANCGVGAAAATPVSATPGLTG